MPKSDITFSQAYRYRVDPKRLTDQARSFLMQNFGCARKVYNLLAGYLYKELEARGFERGPVPNDIAFPEVTYFKKQEAYGYLKHADSLGLANARNSFLAAVRRYNEEYDHASYTAKAIRNAESGLAPLTFRGLKGMPKFHSRAHGDFSYTTNCQYPEEGKNLKRPTARLEGSTLYLPKLKEGLPLVIHRPFPKDAVIGHVTVSMEADGSLYASIQYSYPASINTSFREAALSGDTAAIDAMRFLGLDYSQTDLYVDSEGRKANYPGCYRKSERKLARLRKQLARKEYDQETHTGSKNRAEQLAKIQKLERHIADQRKDFLHKLSTEIVREYDVAVVEDIDLRAMGECLSLGKKLHDNGFGMFRNMLAYKLERSGSVLVKVDRYYPSTKTCHACGYQNPDVVLGVSEWDCPVCGAQLDRDKNAALNIRDEGKRIFAEYYTKWLEEDTLKRTHAQRLHEARKRKKHAA